MRICALHGDSSSIAINQHQQASKLSTWCLTPSAAQAADAHWIPPGCPCCTQLGRRRLLSAPGCEQTDRVRASQLVSLRLLAAPPLRLLLHPLLLPHRPPPLQAAAALATAAAAGRCCPTGCTAHATAAAGLTQGRAAVQREGHPAG